MFKLFNRRPSANHLIGIGLTDDGIAIAHLSRKHNSLHLEHLDCASASSLPEINSKLAHWVREFDVKDSQTNFVLSLSEASIFLTEAPEVEDKELGQAMRWKLKDSSDVDIEKSIVDVFPIPGQRERGRQPMAYVVSAEKELLKSYVSLIEKNDLNLKSIDITALALRNVASKFPEDEMGVAFLSLYAKRGLLSLSRNSNLYLARDLDVGYENFAASAQDTQSDKTGSGLQLENQLSAQPVLDQIVLEVQRSMDYYERYFAQPPIQNLVLAPLPVSIPGLREEISQQLGMKVREMDLTEIVTVQQQAIDRDVQSKCLSAFGAALRMTMAA